MSLLTPLYIAGLLALGVPLILHLIRRRPRNRRRFSSLMFLTQSPPRVTRKSRLEHPFLLSLRLLALTLLALAFARPFLRHLAESDSAAGSGARVAFLVDRSASMQRENLWPQALAKVNAVLDGLSPRDDAALLAFGDRVERLVPFASGTGADPVAHRARIRSTLASLAPAWGAADLGAALAAAAESVEEGRDASGAGGKIVLVSDLAAGSSLDALESFSWPADVALAVERVVPGDGTNAGVSLAADSSSGGASELRLRVTNDRESSAEEFTLAWATREGPLAGVAPVKVHVPPGESRVVRLAKLPEGAADRVLLTGDRQAFDNTVCVAPLKKERVPIVYIGADGVDDAKGELYFLMRAFPETPAREVAVSAIAPGSLQSGDTLREARLVVLSAPVEPREIELLDSYVRAGGTVLCVLGDTAMGRCARALSAVASLKVEEADTASYALLGAVELSHPLFAPFNDPRYNDFAKIQFWRHRRVTLEASAAARVLARFDDGAPALLECQRERGRVLVLASSWRPADSQLARSTKFVPLLAGILEGAGAGGGPKAAYLVGETVELGERTRAGTATVRRPDGTETALAPDARTFTGIDAPGMYALRAGTEERAFGVNVPPAETKTSPLAVEELERRGVRLDRHVAPPEAEARRKQLADMELENSQKLWQWLLVAALATLGLETVLAGFVARAKIPEASP